MSHEDLLAKLLKVLVDQWGAEKVQAALNSQTNKTHSAAEGNSARDRQKSRKKPTAFDLASKVIGPTDLTGPIRQVASMFDQKIFLPTAGDIRDFLEMRGKDLPSTASRSEAFRKVLEELVTMDAASLRQLAQSRQHAGPTQLGPLSEAIRSVGSALRPEAPTEPEQK